MVKIFSWFRHITCLCHALHNLAETIRDKNYLVDKIVAFFKRSLIKNKKTLFIEVTGLILADFRVITMWGTWLEFTAWILNNFDANMTFI